MDRPERQPFSALVRRALRLRCPLCGVTPIFIPFRRVRRFDDWFKPLDGCPRCGYAYDREPGYFLLATWALNYGFVSLFGIGLWLVLESRGGFTTRELLFWVLTPMPVLSLLLVRPTKALWLALDHAFDPAPRPRPRDPEPPGDEDRTENSGSP